MLITVQPFFFASSNSAGVKVPTLVTGKPCAGGALSRGACKESPVKNF
jgi:hypothetical protein